MADVGRPTDYNEAYPAQAEKLCRLGATDVELADFFDICEATLNNWKREHPEFLESIREGKILADIKVANSLYDGCSNQIVIEQQAIKVKESYYDEKGKKVEREKVEVVELEKVIPADFRNQQFWLKNRRSAYWKDKTETELSGKDGGPVQNELQIKIIRDKGNRTTPGDTPSESATGTGSGETV